MKNRILSQPWLLLFMLLWTICPAMNAQAEDFSYESIRAEIDEMLRDVDLTTVPTGILSDYGISLVDLDAFDGTMPANCADFATWKMLYGGLYDSQVNGNSQMKSPTEVFDEIGESKSPIVMLRYRYNQFDSLALEKGWMTFDGEHFHLSDDAPSPYLEKECFAVVPTSEYVDRICFNPEDFQAAAGSHVPAAWKFL